MKRWLVNEALASTRSERKGAFLVEPLLPIEKKLIGWNLGIGLTLLVVLIVVNHFVPITL
jgi:hypothetical protein